MNQDVPIGNSLHRKLLQQFQVAYIPEAPTYLYDRKESGEVLEEAAHRGKQNHKRSESKKTNGK